MPGRKRSSDEGTQADAPAPGVDPALLEEEEAFPRGGGGKLSALEKRQIRLEAEAQVDEDAQQGGVAAGKRRKLLAGKAKASEDEDEGLFAGRAAGAGRAARVPKFVELLKFKDVEEGSHLLGVVVEVHPREVVLALPHGLRGTVPARHVSEPLAALLKREGRHGAGAVSVTQGRAGAAGVTSCPPMAELLRPGQLVRCTVIDVDEGGQHGQTSACLPV